MNVLKNIAQTVDKIPKNYRMKNSIDYIKNDILNIDIEITNPNILNLKSLLFRKPKKIIKIENYGKIMTGDLEIDNDEHSYIANGIPVHNTINLPKETTTEDLSKLLLEYTKDLKGVTVYRDGSREGQILNPLTEQEALEYLKNNDSEVSRNLCEKDVQCASGSCEI